MCVCVFMAGELEAGVHTHRQLSIHGYLTMLCVGLSCWWLWVCVCPLDSAQAPVCMCEHSPPEGTRTDPACSDDLGGGWDRARDMGHPRPTVPNLFLSSSALDYN